MVTRKSTRWLETNKKRREILVQQICEEMLYSQTTSVSGTKVPWGTITRIINETKDDNPWINRNVINFAYKKYLEKIHKQDHDLKITPSTASSAPSSATAGGRPKGQTNLMKQHRKEAITAAKNEITELYKDEKERRKGIGQILPRGWLKQTIKNVCEKRGISEYVSHINMSTIRNRKNTMILQGGGSETLMHEIEPHLVDLICAMARIRRCLTTTESIALANDLISGTELETKIIEWKKTRMEYDPASPVLGKKYWLLFKKRWSHKLVTKRGQKFAMDRSNSLTYANVKQMYDQVYNCMVDAGVASVSDEYCNDYLGPLKTKYHLKHPEMCFVVDEVGSTSSQRGDGHVGGQKYQCETGMVPQIKASHSNERHFTTLGFTSLSGKPVLCLVIIAGVRELYEIETGIDSDADVIGHPSDPDFFEKNRGKGKIYPMGPECEYKGKTIPCLVRWSPNGSITSQILKDAVHTLDHYCSFDRSQQKMPFLLLDGHQSRFEVPFLEYITNADHPWMVCIGVPYGTSLWQVADSKEQNGSFKIALSKIKKKILTQRLDLMMNKPDLSATDIIPMVNYAWDQSFVRVDKNLKAIQDRGWGPLNYALLTDKQIQATMTESESKSYAMMLKQSTATTDMPFQQQTTISHDSTINTASETISTLTNDGGIEMNYNSKYIQRNSVPNTVTIGSRLNYSSGRSAAVIETLLHDVDLQKVRERNKEKADKGKATKEKLDNAKKLTAMLNFNTIGCRVGEDSLKVRMKIAQKKKEEEDQVQQKKDKIMVQRKRKYDELKTKIDNENLPIEKLSLSQLKTLCSFKKQKGDISISKLKRDELLPLWLSWKDRPDVLVEEAAALPSVPVPVPVAEVVNDSGEMITESDDNVMNFTIV